MMKIMDKELQEKAERFLDLFGLDPDFTPGELSSSYRALAKLNHPDVADDTAAAMRMVIINEGYAFLKGARHLLGAGALARRPGPGDAVYRQYRKSFGLLRGAFDDYFGRPGVAGEGDISLLKKRLAEAKSEFARVINEFPYNEWVDDAIDKINSINRWIL